MTTAYAAVNEDGLCLYSTDAPTLFLGDLPITPATHFAFAPAVGARRAALLPFPHDEGKCGKLLDVLCAEEGYGPPRKRNPPPQAPAQVPAQVPAKANHPSARVGKHKFGKAVTPVQHVEVAVEASRPLLDDDVADDDAQPKDRFLLVTAPEPLDAGVFAFVCVKFIGFAEAGRPSSFFNVGICDFGSFTPPNVEFKSGRTNAASAQHTVLLCQLFRTAAFLQCDELCQMCKLELLKGWCLQCVQVEKHASGQSGDNLELRLEGLVRKSTTMLRRARAALSIPADADTSTGELLQAFEEWTPSDLSGLENEMRKYNLQQLSSAIQVTSRGAPGCSPADATVDAVFKCCLPDVLIPLAELRQ